MMEKELQDQDNQSMELEKEKEEAKKELDTINQLLYTIKHLLSRKRTRPRYLQLEGKIKEAEMKKIKEEMKKREKEWKAKMKKKEEELLDKNNQILKLRLELSKEKKDKDEAKKELAAIKRLNVKDLLPRKRGKPTDEIKGEYVEEEDVKVKTESKEIAEKDDDNNGSPRYSHQVQLTVIKVQYINSISQQSKLVTHHSAINRCHGPNSPISSSALVRIII